MQEEVGDEEMETSTGASASTPIVIDDREPSTNQQELGRLQDRAEERMRSSLRRENIVHQQGSNGVRDDQPSIELSISSNGTAGIVSHGAHQQGRRPDHPIPTSLQVPDTTKTPLPGSNHTKQQPQQTTSPQSLFVRSPTSGFLRLADDVTMDDIETLEVNELAGGG
jgi:hypothetical protein